MSSNLNRQALETARANFSAWQEVVIPTSKKYAREVSTIEYQQELLQAAADSSPSLASLIRDALDIAAAEIEGPDLTPIAPSELQPKQSIEWETRMCSELGHMPRELAADSVWWYLLHIRWLEIGTIQSPPAETFRARVNPDLLTNSPEHIEPASLQLQSGSERSSLEASEDSKVLDQSCRNLLRGLGGLPHIRRPYRVAIDPPIAAAWWRGELASAAEMATTDDDLGWSSQQFHTVLATGNLWDRFMERSQRSLPVLLEPRAIAAVCYLYSEGSLDSAGVLREVARRCADRSPAKMAWEDLAAPVPTASA